MMILKLSEELPRMLVDHVSSMVKPTFSVT